MGMKLEIKNNQVKCPHCHTWITFVKNMKEFNCPLCNKRYSVFGYRGYWDYINHMVRAAIRSVLLFSGVASIAYGTCNSGYYIILGAVFIGIYTGWQE